MEHFALLELFETQPNNLTKNRISTPEAIGEGLFQSFLKKERVSMGDASEPKTSRSLKNLKEGIGLHGSLSGSLRLPREAIPRLVSLLERYGMDRNRLESLAGEATGKDGFLHLGRFWNRLMKLDSERTSGNDLVIEGSQVPALEKFLFQIGLGAGDVKTLRESTLDGRGDVTLKALQEVMSKVFPNMDSEKALPGLLNQAGIAYRPRDLENHLDVRTLEGIMSELSNPASRTSQQKVKEALAALLRDKGFGPSEIKSFLETLSVRAMKPSLESLQGKPSEEELNALLDQIRIGTRQEWGKKGGKGAGPDARRAKTFEPVDPFRSTSHLKEGADGKVNAASDQAIGFRNKGPRGQDGVLEGRALDRQGENKVAGFKDLIPPSIEGRPTVAFHNAGDAGGLGPKNSAVLPEPLPKILDRMVWMADGGRQRSRIQLSPPELGRLDVHLLVENGRLRAHLGVESQWAKEVFDANLPQLKQQLADAGFTVDRFDVTVGLGQDDSEGGEELWNADHGKERPKERKRVRAVEVKSAEGLRRGETLETYKVNVRV